MGTGVFQGAGDPARPKVAAGIDRQCRHHDDPERFRHAPRLQCRICSAAQISRRAAVPKLAAIEGPIAHSYVHTFPRVDVGANAICLFAFPELHEVHADIAKTADLRPQHLAWIHVAGF